MSILRIVPLQVRATTAKATLWETPMGRFIYGSPLKPDDPLFKEELTLSFPVTPRTEQ